MWVSSIIKMPFIVHYIVKKMNVKCHMVNVPTVLCNFNWSLVNCTETICYKSYHAKTKMSIIKGYILTLIEHVARLLRTFSEICLFCLFVFMYFMPFSTLTRTYSAHQKSGDNLSFSYYLPLHHHVLSN